MTRNAIVSDVTSTWRATDHSREHKQTVWETDSICFRVAVSVHHLRMWYTNRSKPRQQRNVSFTVRTRFPTNGFLPTHENFAYFVCIFLMHLSTAETLMAVQILPVFNVSAFRPRSVPLKDTRENS